MQGILHEYTLEDCIWDWIELAKDRRRPERWIALNRHIAKRELIEVLKTEFGIVNAADFIALVCKIPSEPKLIPLVCTSRPMAFPT